MNNPGWAPGYKDPKTNIESRVRELASLKKRGRKHLIQSYWRGELLNREIFYRLLEAKVLIERCRAHYDRVRPHSWLGYRPPAPQAIVFEAPAAGPRFFWKKV